MKYNFIKRFYDASTENKGGGFTPEEKSHLANALKDVQTAIESKQKSLVETELKKYSDTINDAIKKFGDKLAERDENDIKNQKDLDEVLVKFKEIQAKANTTPKEKKSLNVAIAEAFTDPDNIKRVGAVSKGEKVRIELKGVIDLSAPLGGVELKTVGDMTTGNLTGDGVITYNSRQVLLPTQKNNARDMISTVRSETGLYVTYKESGSEGSISRQTEGQSKSQIDYDFTEVKTVSQYIAGFAVFSKQMTKHLPWLTNTLPRLLQRDFFKKENRAFWDAIYTAATGVNTTSETDDVKQVMDWITKQFSADYIPSFGLLHYEALNKLNKLLYTNGYYQGSGGVLSQADGSIRISGVPIVPVTWIPSYDKFTTFDTDYIERVEVEGLAIEFFQEDNDNVRKNLITARIECMEEFNPMQPASIIVGDFGNSSSS